MTINIYNNLKYEITEDLRLHVWNIDSNEAQTPPFYFQNEQLDGTPWESREQVENYFFATFGLKEEKPQGELVQEELAE